MATKKKSVKKKAVKKKAPVKKKSTKKKSTSKKVVKKTSQSTSKVLTPGSKHLAFRDLIIFSILSLISYLLYLASGSEVSQNLFYAMFIMFFFIALAFLIAFLVFIFAKKSNPTKKKRK